MKLLAAAITTATKVSYINGRKFILSSFLFLLFLTVLASVSDLRLHSAVSPFLSCLSNPITSSSSSDLQQNSTAASEPDVQVKPLRVLIGILTLPDQYLRRNFLRQVYGIQRTPADAQVDIRFVFCNLTKDDQRLLVALEILRYDDIIILNCTENMNNGKTFTYFSSLPALLSPPVTSQPPYHYVMKADDDTYIRLENLVKTLRPLPREDLYYGYVIPCNSMDPFRDYMSGMGYLVSWDLVEWISQSDIPRRHLKGPEDKVFGEWMKIGHKAKNRYNAKWSMYNYPEPPTRCTHELVPGTVAVHLLKTQDKWIRTLRYFNVTLDLKPSNLYHIPHLG